MYVKKDNCSAPLALSHKPHTYLVYLHDADWSAFVWSDTAKRIEILKPYVRDIRLGLYAPRELIWIDLESIKNADKEEII